MTVAELQVGDRIVLNDEHDTPHTVTVTRLADGWFKRTRLIYFRFGQKHDYVCLLRDDPVCLPDAIGA